MERQQQQQRLVASVGGSQTPKAAAEVEAVLFRLSTMCQQWFSVCAYSDAAVVAASPASATSKLDGFDETASTRRVC